MKKSKLLLVLGVLGCMVVTGCANNSKLVKKSGINVNTKVVTLGIGDSISYDSVTIKILDAVLLEESIIGVFVAINNDKPQNLDYSAEFSWGAISTGNGQKLQSILYSDPYIWQNYFEGKSIYPVATATDLITFQQFEPQSTEGYTFNAEPPIDGFPPFRVFFLNDDLRRI